MPVVKPANSQKLKRPQKLIRSLSIKDFYEKRNKVLITRSIGGLGDILMHRMMFEDFKLLMPDAELHFACPKAYHQAVSDHPFLDKVLAVDEVNWFDYVISYNTSTSCGRTEMGLAPLSGPHRSDIWANHCGVQLTKHQMHIHLTDAEKAQGKKIIEAHRDRVGPTVVFATVSAMKTKNLLDFQVLGTVDNLRSRGCFVFGMHTSQLPVFAQNEIPLIQGLRIREWMAVIDQADYVVSVDTAAFHCAGGLEKPLVGIFTWADGLVYGKHFPTFELVQKHRASDSSWTCGPCYNWCSCPKTKAPLKPCLTEISVDMIVAGMDQMFARFPVKSH